MHHETLLHFNKTNYFLKNTSFLKKELQLRITLIKRKKGGQKNFMGFSQSFLRQLFYLF